MTDEEFVEIEERIRNNLEQVNLSDDPVEEVHQVREAIAAACNYNIDTMYELIREDERRAALAGKRFYSRVGDEFVDVTDKIIKGEL